MGWTTPKNVSKVGSFMGLSGYYTRFLKGFSRIAYPITSLQRKGEKFEWTQWHEDSLWLLKNLLPMHQS
jgi:hypothetical protein